MKITGLIFSIFLFVSFSFGQEKPRAELVDELGGISCDDLLGRMDYFFIEIRENPGAIGYVVSFGNKNKKLEILYQEMILKGHINFRRFDKNRIKFVPSEQESELRTRFWLLPKGVPTPDFKEVKYNFKLPESTKPFKFTDENLPGYCPATGFEEAYLEVLQSNPNARGNLVIYAKNQKDFNTRKKELLTQLSEIPPKRLRFFYVKEDYLSVEYWIVPKRKRN